MPPGVDQSQARNVTVDDCATLCSLESRCSAFSYNPLNVRSLACSTEPQCRTALVLGQGTQMLSCRLTKSVTRHRE